MYLSAKQAVQANGFLLKFHARFSSGFVPSVYLCEMVCAATKIAEVCIVLPLVHSRRTFNPQKSMTSLLNLNKNGRPSECGTV